MKVIDTGRMPYKKSYDLQLECQKKVIEDEDNKGYLIITETTPTITKGIRGEADDIYLPREALKESGIEVVDIRRGGLVTFHGPGQLVIYPIVNLKRMGKSIRWYIDTLQELVVDVLRDIGITPHKKDNIIGVFGERGKVCAIGVEVKKWTTLHGIAINNDINLDYFKMINPCGIEEYGVSSIKNEGIEVSREEIIEVFKRNFIRLFDVEIS